MDKTVFEARAISFFHDRKYIFYEELQHGATLKKMTMGQYAGLLALGAVLGAGMFMIDQPTFADGEVKTELIKLGALCDLIGIKLYGSVNLVLFIYCDDLTDEALIGKCHLIRENLAIFKKFAMRIGWQKQPVSAKAFCVFENSQKAFNFRRSVQEQCKHFGMFNKCSVLPWGIDLNAKSAWPYQGLPLNWIKPAELETKLFS